MNRIILIGNGFDLAHGLPTSYADFINDYWVQYGSWLSCCWSNIMIDELCSISLKQENNSWFDIIPHYHINGQVPPTPKEIIEDVKSRPDDFIIKKAPFFSKIDNEIDTKKWVDIESEYYLQLRCIAKKTDRIYNDPKELDSEFETIKAKLIDYLQVVQKDRIVPDLVKYCIHNTIYGPLNVDDISIEGKEKFDRFLDARAKFLFFNQANEIDIFLKHFGRSYRFTRGAIDTYTQSLKLYKNDSLDSSKHLAAVYDKSASVPDCFLLPDQVLLLNFNYTRTADLYIPEGSEFRVNHIHGELGNEMNPIIFGYGDELDEDYKAISNLNDNDYLSHIKSIRYLETDNYRRLLTFIDSAPYQIYIMGHSCGNSDRTLLNTLFEHRNCVSIKPFYHLKADGTDNYIEIVQNISRNFNDKQSMRDRVVNKSYCQPLVTA